MLGPAKQSKAFISTTIVFHIGFEEKQHFEENL